MPTYFVRKNGSDAYSTAQAQNPATAWLTIDKAANNVAAGDTVYVGSGTYREAVTMDTSGSSGSEIKFIADVDGSQTSDAGLVVISAFTDSNTASRVWCWDPDGRTYIEVYDFVMQGGTNGVVYSANTTDDNYEGCIFDGCVFEAGPVTSDHGIYIDMNAATTPTNAGLTIRNCTFNGPGIRILWNANETAERDLKVVIENNMFIGHGANNITWGAFFWDLSSAGTYGSGGVDFRNNTVSGYSDGVGADHGTSTTYPINVYNNLLHCYVNAIEKQTSNDGAIVSDYNTIMGGLANVTAGANDRVDTSTYLLAGIADLPLYRKWGWSPFLPFEPMRPNGDDDWTSLIGDASATYAPATDLYGNPRPMHGTADDRGAVEGRARPEQETTTVRTGSNAFRFDGAGYHDFSVAVAAQSTTITIYGRYDSNYTGTLPSMTVTNDDIMTEVTDTMTGAANQWEQLTSGAFTPSAAGVVKVRITSSDTSATGQCFFDDLDVA